MGSGGCAGVGEGAGSLTEWLDRPSHTTIGYTTAREPQDLDSGVFTLFKTKRERAQRVRWGPLVMRGVLLVGVSLSEDGSNSNSNST